MAVNERLQSLTEFVQEKENISAEVSSLYTPGRKPLRIVQENVVGTPDFSRSLKNTLSSTSYFTPNGFNSNKGARKPKRLSIPVHVFRRTLKQRQRYSSPLKLSKDPKPILVEKQTNDAQDLKEAETRRSGDVGRESCEIVSASVDREEQLDLFAEGVVNQIFRNIVKEHQEKQDAKTQEYKQQIQEFTQIILQMNKERLHLEKKLSDYKKEHLDADHTSSQKNRSTTINRTTLEKELSKKTLEIQRLRKELQQAKGNKVPLESNKEECRQLKIEINQLQHQLRDIPGLKNELQKSRQQVTHLKEVMLACRRENNSQKSLVGKLEKELTSKEARAKLYTKECNRNIATLKTELLGKDDIIKELNEQVAVSEKEIRMYNQQLESVGALVGRLEVVSEKAERFKAFAEQKVHRLTKSLSEKNSLCETLEEQLQVSRNESMQHCQESTQLKSKTSDLQHEVDIGHLEISRQGGVINSLKDELGKLRSENAMYQEHLELIQSLNQETNTFLVEENRALEETTKEMQKELECARRRGQKVEELQEEVKLSRSMFMDKQEELDATQCHAHLMAHQLQNEITDAQQSLDELWNIVRPLLEKFRQQAHLEKQENEVLQDQANPTTPKQSPLSLVQSVLSAVAQGTKPEDSLPQGTDENDNEEPIVTLCNQISDLKQALLELADIGHGQAASLQAQEKVAQLENDREALNQRYSTMMKDLKCELAAYHSNEANMANTIQRQKTKIASLTGLLNTNQENLQEVYEKYDSMSDLLEVEMEQRLKISDLSVQLQHKEQSLRRVESEKECIVEQLGEATRRMNEMTSNENYVPGKLLEEKFVAERKLKEIKDKWMEYLIKADDNLNDYKITSTQKITALEKNLQQAKNEICHLDEVLEKIRIVLHSNKPLISQCPPLSKVLQFLDGDESDK